MAMTASPPARPLLRRPVRSHPVPPGRPRRVGREPGGLRRRVHRVPGGGGAGHRGRGGQEGVPDHQPGRRGQGAGGGAHGVRLHGRPGHPSPRGRGAAGPGHRRAPGGGRPGRGPLEPATPRSLQSRPRARGSGPQREGGAARPGGPNGAGPGPSRAPGHRDARLSRADRADRDLRQLAAGGRAALDPTERDGGRRGRRPARGRELRGRRARGVRLLHRGRALGALREGGGAPGPREAGRGRRAGGDDDGRAGTGLAGHPAPRGDRPRPRGRLQPEGRVRVHGARRASGSPPISSPSSTTGPSPTAGARSTSTTRGRPRAARSSSRTACCAGTCRTGSTRGSSERD